MTDLTNTSRETSSTLRVLFIHGLEGSPEGTKARYLSERFEAKTPRMQTANFPRCVDLQARIVREFAPDVVVGSSFGGAVALELIHKDAWRGPTLLLAPALDHFGVDAVLPTHSSVLVVHGKNDAVVDIGGSRRLVENASGHAELVEVDDTHRLQSLTDGESLADLVRRAIELARSS